MDRLSTRVGGVSLASPVILAAGTSGYIDELAGAIDLGRVGALVTKSITVQPREGNPTWRIIESKTGMLNAIGLANVGLDAFLEHVAPRAANAPCPVVASVAGFSIDEFVRLAASIDDTGLFPAIELNVSCPNVHVGVEFSAEPRLLRDLIGEVRPCVRRASLWVKLSPIPVGAPGATMPDVARAAIEGKGSIPPGTFRPGADALSLCNTFPAMAIDPETSLPRLANVTGGLSGPGIHPIVVRLIREVHRRVAREAGVDLIGVGGILNWDDAAEFILAGASAVQIGTGLFADPGTPARVTRGLSRWAARRGVSNLSELVGKVADEPTRSS